MNFPSIMDLAALFPLMVISGWFMIVLLAESFSAGPRWLSVAWLSVVGLVVTAAWGLFADRSVVPGVIALDGYAVYFNVLICALAVVAILMSMDFVPLSGIVRGEYYPLVLAAVAGLMTMAAATDLIVMFLGLEMMSTAVYVLAGIRKQDPKAGEAALKYFLLGAFASAFLLYGIALVYARVGSTGLADVAQALGSGSETGADSLLLSVGLGMLLVGFGFKVAAVPFHLWTPDVYEGAPSPVTAFMATAVKAGAFAALLKTVLVALAPLASAVQPLLWIGSAATMTIGNLVALRQTSLKRMLAYSSIAHTGYLLMALVAGGPEAGGAALFYLAAYGAMNLGAFGVMTAMARPDAPGDRIADLAGLGQSQPLLALIMTVFMLSLTGIPPLGGFVGKLYLFSAVLSAGQISLVVLAVINSVVSAVYYLGVIRTMYFEDAESPRVSAGPALSAALLVAVVMTVVLGIAPSFFLGAASRAFASIGLGY